MSSRGGGGVDDQNRVNLFSVSMNTDARIRTVRVALADTQSGHPACLYDLYLNYPAGGEFTI